MNHQQAIRNFSCSICDQLAEDAVEGDCCGILLCQQCHNDLVQYANKKKSDYLCPKCRQSNYEVHSSFMIRRLISQIKIRCSLGCGQQIEKKSLQEHEKNCKSFNQCFKNPSNFYKLIIGLTDFWNELKLIESKGKDNKTKNHFQIICLIEQLVINLLTNFKNVVGEEYKYWQFLLQDPDKSGDLLLYISLIYYQRQQYVQSIMHSTKMMNTMRYRTTILLEFQILIASIHMITKHHHKKQNKHQIYSECIKILELLGQALNLENQGHVCLKLICLHGMASLSVTQQQIENYTVQISQLESRLQQVSENIMKSICWGVHSRNQFHLSEGQQKQNQIQIYFNLRMLIVLLKISQEEKIFYQLLQKCSQIFNHKDYTKDLSNSTLHLAEFHVITALIQVIGGVEQQMGSMHLEQIVNKFYRYNIYSQIYQLNCYLLGHKKFNKALVISKVTEDDFKSNIFKMATQYSNIHHRLQQEKGHKKNQDLIHEKLKQGLHNILILIGYRNRNIRNQMLIRYFLADLQFNKIDDDDIQEKISIFIMRNFYRYYKQQIALEQQTRVKNNEKVIGCKQLTKTKTKQQLNSGNKTDDNQALEKQKQQYSFFISLAQRNNFKKDDLKDFFQEAINFDLVSILSQQQDF